MVVHSTIYNQFREPSVIIPRSHSTDPENCLLTEEKNPIQQNPQ